jgi:hypothetical protein
VTETTNFVNNIYLAVTKLEPSTKKQDGAILTLKLDLYTYIYWINRTTLLSVNNNLTLLNHHEISEVYRQCIEKGIRNMRLDDEFLG